MNKNITDEEIEKMADNIIKCIKGNTPASIKQSIINSFKAALNYSADEIRGILWKYSDSADEPESSWIDSDKFENIIKEITSKTTK